MGKEQGLSYTLTARHRSGYDVMSGGLTLCAHMHGGLQYSLLSVSVCVRHTAVLDDGEYSAADTVDASSM